MTLLKLTAALVLCAALLHATDQTPKTAPNEDAPAASTDCGQGRIMVEATPNRADILVDGNFAGNAPATLRLAPGKHSIRLAAPGYGEWQRDVTVFGGSEARLAVTLTKADSATAATAAPTGAPAPAAVAAAAEPPAPVVPASVTPAATPAQPAPAASPVAPAEPSSPAECGALGAFSDEHPKNRSDGIKVTGFAPHSPAAKAGLQIGDYIVSVGGAYVFTIDDLSTQLCKYKPGAQVAVRYRRNVALDETTVVLGRP